MAEEVNPLLRLEKLSNSDNYVEKEIGFCAQWCLDNLCKFTNQTAVSKLIHSFSSSFG